MWLMHILGGSVAPDGGWGWGQGQKRQNPCWRTWAPGPRRRQRGGETQTRSGATRLRHHEDVGSSPRGLQCGQPPVQWLGVEARTRLCCVRGSVQAAGRAQAAVGELGSSPGAGVLGTQGCLLGSWGWGLGPWPQSRRPAVPLLPDDARGFGSNSLEPCTSRSVKLAQLAS